MRGPAIAVFVGVIGTASMALAHSVVDEGAAQYAEGNLERALEAFARAEGVDDLDREALIRMLVYRALIQHALGWTEALERNLAQLAVIDREHVFGPEVPPAILEVYDRMRARNQEPVRVTSSDERVADVVRIHTAVADDTTDLGRRTRISARAGDGPWRVRSGAELELSVGETERVEYYVELLGPGGVVIAASGSRDAPRILPGREPPAVPVSSGAGPEHEVLGRGAETGVVGVPVDGGLGTGGSWRSRDGDDGGSGFWWVTIGVTGLAVAGVVAFFLLRPSEDTTSFSRPEVDFPE